MFRRSGVVCWVLLLAVQGLGLAERMTYIGIGGAAFLDAKASDAERNRTAKELDDYARRTLSQKELLMPLGGLNAVVVSMVSAQNYSLDDFSTFENWKIREDVIDSYAQQISQVRAQLTDKEWNKTVKLWSNVLHSCAAVARSGRFKNYPGLLGNVGALAADATRIIWIPALYIVCFGKDLPYRSGGELILGSVPSVISDIGFLVPNTVQKTRYLFASPARQEQKLMKALTAFKEHVEGLQKKIGKPLTSEVP